MKKIEINSPKYGAFTVTIDAEDWDRVSQHKWGVRYDPGFKSRDVFYVCSGFYTPASEGGPKTRQVQLHRFIMDAPKGMVVDHINGDTLDNRKENLRICTPTQNKRNSRPAGSVEYKGVLRHGPITWKATCHKEYLGLYRTKEEAALVVDKAAKEKFGEYAYLNFPHGPSEEVLKIIEEGEKQKSWTEYSDQYTVKSKTSKYRGVRLHNGKWEAHISINRKSRYLGRFDKEIDAARAWDNVAIVEGKKFLNFPGEIKTNKLLDKQ